MTRRKQTTMALLSVLVLCLTLAPLRLTAQQPAPQPQNPQTQSNPSPSPAALPTVKLNFIAIDEANRSVADVRQEDVSVLEDGVPQTVTYFAREESPASYGLVVDNSGSMKPIFEWVIRTAGSLINTNKSDDETFLLRFVDTDEIRLLQDFTSDKNDFIRAFDNMHTGGGQTALIDAVYTAAEHVAEHRKPGEHRRYALVLITDGEDRSSYYKREQLFNLLHKTVVQVFVIGLTGELDRGRGLLIGSPFEKSIKLLTDIAEESGGRVFFPKKVEELKNAVAEIAQDLHAQYVIAYAPTNLAADGKYRKVQVQIAAAAGRPRRNLIGRLGYFALGGESKEKIKKK